MDNKDLAMIYKALAHILFNQRRIMEHMNIDNFYATQDTDELAVLFGQLAEKYYEKDE